MDGDLQWRPRVVREAFLRAPNGGLVFLGTFDPVTLKHGQSWQRMAKVSAPSFTRLDGPAPMVEEPIRTHDFRVEPIGPPLAQHFGFVVSIGDPVEWLRGWTWRDHSWRRVWTGERPNPWKT